MKALIQIVYKIISLGVIFLAGTFAIQFPILISEVFKSSFGISDSVSLNTAGFTSLIIVIFIIYASLLILKEFYNIPEWLVGIGLCFTIVPILISSISIFLVPLKLIIVIPSIIILLFIIYIITQIDWLSLKLKRLISKAERNTKR